MPMFGLQQPPAASESGSTLPSMHRTSEESIRTEFCEGPLLDDFTSTDPRPGSPFGEAKETVVDDFPRLPAWGRAELIQRIKESQHPTWQQPQTPTRASVDVDSNDQRPEGPNFVNSPASLLPAIELKAPISPEQAAHNDEDARRANQLAGHEIQRPRSALHAGDFTEPSNQYDKTWEPSFPDSTGSRKSPANECLGSSSIDIDRPRHNKSFSLGSNKRQSPFDYSQPQTSVRTPSFQPYSSSFVYKPPTSPLVQQESNEDLDEGQSGAQSSRKYNRRRTLPADALQGLRSLPSTLAQAARQPTSFQTDISFSSQNREARRAVSSGNNYFASVSPPTPGFFRSRRTSFSGEVSPLQPSSMVGSYEESILRGRMSTTPSKPVDFTAQIGALGKGDCKPKFPDHVTLTFPAVYYNWSAAEAADIPSNTEPSPYVGQIDIEHGIPTPKRKEKKNKRANENATRGKDSLDNSSLQQLPSDSSQRRHRSPSPMKRPPGGSYRIPQQGQLQILIKNPNKTAVKLFLIPYDLHEMEPGTKTFIRQNSYSAGPIIETPVLTRTLPDYSSSSKSASRGQRPTLRYSIHIHICCASLGRYYIYKAIKVVFANRVPDNKERLQNEIRLPEPRFSPYRPVKEVRSSPSLGSMRRSIDKENRRRSYQIADSFESMARSPPRRFPSFGQSTAAAVPAVPAPPGFNLLIAPEHPRQVPCFETPEPFMGRTSTALPVAALSSPPCEPSTRVPSDPPGSMHSSASSNGPDSPYNKLSKGDLGYGGLLARPGTPEYSESLLSRRLRSFDMERSKPTSSP